MTQMKNGFTLHHKLLHRVEIPDFKCQNGFTVAWFSCRWDERGGVATF